VRDTLLRTVSTKAANFQCHVIRRNRDWEITFVLFSLGKGEKDEFTNHQRTSEQATRLKKTHKGKRSDSSGKRLNANAIYRLVLSQFVESVTGDVSQRRDIYSRGSLNNRFRVRFVASPPLPALTLRLLLPRHPPSSLLTALRLLFRALVACPPPRERSGDRPSRNSGWPSTDESWQFSQFPKRFPRDVTIKIKRSDLRSTFDFCKFDLRDEHGVWWNREWIMVIGNLEIRATRSSVNSILLNALILASGN